MSFQPAYTIFPLGDSSLIIDFGSDVNEDTNKKVLRLFYQLKALSLPGILDIIPAYNSLSVFYDVIFFSREKKKEETVFEFVTGKIQQLIESTEADLAPVSRAIRIPVCYALPYAPDLQEVANRKGLSTTEVIQIHIARSYRVFMIGFLPGFAYMGEVDERIETPRKAAPLQVVPGSVGIAGKQTGVYTLTSPGGWQIIGRTPLPLFNAEASPPVLLEPGDTVQFFSITEDEFENYQGRHIGYHTG